MAKATRSAPITSNVSSTLRMPRLSATPPSTRWWNGRWTNGGLHRTAHRACRRAVGLRKNRGTTVHSASHVARAAVIVQRDRREKIGTAEEAEAARDNGTALRSEQMTSKVLWLKTKRAPVERLVAEARIIGPSPRLRSA